MCQRALIPRVWTRSILLAKVYEPSGLWRMCINGTALDEMKFWWMNFSPQKMIKWKFYFINHIRLIEFCVKRLDEKLDHAEFGKFNVEMINEKMSRMQKKNQYKVVHENLLLCTRTWNHQLDLTWKWFCKTCCFISKARFLLSNLQVQFLTCHWYFAALRVLQSLHAIISVRK
jgi:hypothetical protein